MKSFLSTYCPWIPLLLLCALHTYKAIDFPAHDFSNYYFGGKLLADGNFTSEIYFPYWFNSQIASLGYSGLFTSYAPNTPFLAVVFYPISFVPLASAKLIFNCISVLLFLFSLYRLIDHYKIKPIYILLLPVLFFIPIRNELLFGQVYFLLFFLLTESLLAYEKKQFYKMAFLLGFAILFKVFPVFLILIFIFRKQFKPLLLTLVFCLGFIGISLFFVDWKVWTFFFQTVFPKASNGEISGNFVDNYQSVFMFLKRLLVYEKIENPNPFFHAESWFSAIIFAFKIGILVCGYFISRKASNTLFVFSYWILASVFVSPYGSTYTFILFVFLFLTLLKSEVSTNMKIILSALLFLLCNFPLSIFIGFSFPVSYIRMFLLVAFAVLFVALEMRKTAFIKTLLLSSIVLVLATFLPQPAPHKDEVFSEMPILVYDYRIQNNLLIYSYWNQKGENLGLIPFKNTSVKELNIKENQIVFKNKILTHDSSNKYKPLLIDDRTILYLSDYDRGIGFYTLRKIEFP